MSLNNMFDSKEIKKSDKSHENHSADTQNRTNPEQNEKKQAGRPRTKKEAEKIINISVPLSTYKKMNLAKLNYNNNLTLYINSLIEQDLDKNLDKYKEKLLDI